MSKKLDIFDAIHSDRTAAKTPRPPTAHPVLKPAGPIAKHAPVQLPDGTRGKVAFTDGKNARVKTDEGKSVNVKHVVLRPAPELTAPKSGAKLRVGDAVSHRGFNGTVKGKDDKGKIQVDWHA